MREIEQLQDNDDNVNTVKQKLFFGLPGVDQRIQTEK